MRRGGDDRDVWGLCTDSTFGTTVRSAILAILADSAVNQLSRLGRCPSTPPLGATTLLQT
jgi:hypothetical protein